MNMIKNYEVDDIRNEINQTERKENDKIFERCYEHDRQISQIEQSRLFQLEESL